MTIKSKLKTFFFLEDDFDDSSESNQEHAEPIKQRKQQQTIKTQNVVSLQTVQKSSTSKVILVEPHSYSEASEIADQLKNRRAVVINLQRTENEQGRQIIDFISGVVYAINGEIQKIGLNIFLCTPDNVEVSGNISDLIPNQDHSNLRW
jgi:cell division inhibitor SepF